MIDSSDHGTVRLLRLAHGKVNALDTEIFAALESALDDARGEPVQALVLTGNGHVFSAGVDLFRVLDNAAGYIESFLAALSAGLERLFAFPKPIVAAVDGHAIAGGCVLACAADRRLAAEGEGRIGLPELRVGVPFPAAALEVVRYAVGDHALPDLVLTGTTYSVEEARSLGLVDRVVPASKLIDVAVEEASDLAVLGGSFALSKQQLRRTARDRITTEGRLTDDEVLRLWQSPATHEAIRGYLERTLGR